MRSDRESNPPWGLFGGKPGAGQRSFLNPEGENDRYPTKFVRVLKKDDVFRAKLPGAGGYGDPWTRDPALVAEDLHQEKMSFDHARETYGVVIDPGAFGVDIAATAKLRAWAERD